ncbi:MAG: ATP-binding protein [Dehalococcoidia bacterium]|nr:ATP-binding protein [Dehalococcoidia bacterium]
MAEPAAAAAIRALLSHEVDRMRAAGIPVGEDEYRGLYIGDREADRLRDEDQPDPGAEWAAHRDELAAALDAVIEADARMVRLAKMAGLGSFERRLLALCHAVESDLGLERLISYAQDDVSKKRPRVELATRLLESPACQAAAGSCFEPGAALRRLRLIAVHDEPGQPATPLLARSLSLDPRIAGFLSGRDDLDPQLQPFARILPARDAAPVSAVAELAALPAIALQPPVVVLHGPDVAAREAAASCLAAGAGVGLLEVRIQALSAELGAGPALTVALREGALQDATVLLTGADELSPADAAALRARLREEWLAPLVLIGTKEPFLWPGVSIMADPPSFEERVQLWAESLGEWPGGDDGGLASLAGKFRLGTREIGDAVLAARGRARARAPQAPAVTPDDLYAAARDQSAPVLSDMAKKIRPHYQWDDLILPRDARDQLREMCAHVEHRHQVYEVWGFERRLAMGKGLMALFAGNSGTGKTMAADVLAGTLGLDLYKIDLSGVVSKYIGETEKNLGAIFRDAEASSAILFFDEADALFGKRSEVKDAHDRYANIETAYLLQRMEEYSGVVILATNLKMNLDDAFLRRLHFVIDFPMPEEEDRRRIWEGTVPKETPLGDDVDFAFLARQFKIAGGNIRNIVLAAAFLAASESSDVRMSHFIRAVRREYQKLGRMVTDSEFGPYTGLLR